MITDFMPILTEKSFKALNARRKKLGIKPIKRTSKKLGGTLGGRTYSSYASYEKQKASFAKKIRKIQTSKTLTKAQAQRMNKLIAEYIRRFSK